MTAGPSIRNARRGDVPSLVLLWTAQMEENARLDPRLSPHPPAREHVAGQFGLWLQDPERLVYVAEEGRVVIGYAAGRVSPGTGWHQPLRMGEITDCFVVPARRRQGIARRLATRVTEALFNLNLDTIRLQVAALNPASLSFWRSLGFDPLETVVEWHGRGAEGPSPPPEVEKL